MKVELRRSMDGALSHKHAMSMQRGTKKHAASCTRRRHSQCVGVGPDPGRYAERTELR